jgi:hypothetical protein
MLSSALKALMESKEIQKLDNGELLVYKTPNVVHRYDASGKKTIMRKKEIQELMSGGKTLTELLDGLPVVNETPSAKVVSESKPAKATNESSRLVGNRVAVQPAVVVDSGPTMKDLMELINARLPAKSIDDNPPVVKPKRTYNRKKKVVKEIISESQPTKEIISESPSAPAKATGESSQPVINNALQEELLSLMSW